MARDIDIEMTTGRDGEIIIHSGREDVLNSIKNVLLTSRGERVMRPTFGSPVRLFAPDMGDLTILIRETLQREVPEAELLDVRVEHVNDDPATRQITVVVDIAGQTVSETIATGTG